MFAMEYLYNANIRCRDDIGTKHAIELDLDLELPGLLRGKHLAAELAFKQEALRTELFKTAAETIVPEIIAQTGIPSGTPEGTTRTTQKTVVHSEADYRESNGVEGTVVSVRDTMRITMDIMSDRHVTAMQALRANAGNVADSIANDVLAHLRRKYLGLSGSHTSSQSRMANGQVIDTHLEREGAPPSAN